MSARILYGKWVCSNALLTVVSLRHIIGDAASNIQTGALRSIGCHARLHVHRQTRESQHRPTTARNPAPWFLEWSGMVLTVSNGSEISLW
jgi:hypothetical protein